jgi:hypothetical protein
MFWGTSPRNGSRLVPLLREVPGFKSLGWLRPGLRLGVRERVRIPPRAPRLVPLLRELPGFDSPDGCGQD